MSPQSQLRWAIIAGLLMWAPAGFAVVFGHMDILRGGLLFVAALIIAYIGMSILGYLINTYQQTQEMVARAQKQIERIERRNAEDKAAEEEEERKRRSDD
jgi:cytochrome b subunit of formate dehydrogenase